MALSEIEEKKLDQHLDSYFTRATENSSFKQKKGELVTLQGYVKETDKIELPELTEADKGESAIRVARNVFLIGAAFLLLIALITFATAAILGAGIFGTFILACFFTGAGFLGAGGILGLCHYLVYIKPLKNDPLSFKQQFSEKVWQLDASIDQYNKCLGQINEQTYDVESIAQEIKESEDFKEVDMDEKEFEQVVKDRWTPKMNKFFFGDKESREKLSIDKEKLIVRDMLYETDISEIYKVEEDRKFKF